VAEGYGSVFAGTIACIGRAEEFVSVTLPLEHCDVVAGAALRDRLRKFIASEDGAVFEWRNPGPPVMMFVAGTDPRELDKLSIIEKWGVGADFMLYEQVRARQRTRPASPWMQSEHLKGRSKEQVRSDSEARARLITKIRRSGTVVSSGGDSLSMPVVTVDDFFSGNCDRNSIGVNLSPHPGIDRFRDVLNRIRSRKDVQDVLVEIYEFDESSDAWPYTERIYVLTKAKAETVRRWLAPIEPTEISEGWFGAVPPEAPCLRAGYRVVAAWWD
jgi:hypothetical protein